MAHERRGTAAMLLACVAAATSAEPLTWEAASVASGSPRQVLASGVKTYSPGKDIVVQEAKSKRGGSPWWEKGPGYEELESVEFLDDIVLRYQDDMRKPPGTHTHEVLVRKGSVFRCAP